MLVIFSFSSDTGKDSSLKSDGLINSTLNVFGYNLSPRDKKMILKYMVKPIRKLAHFIIYLLLGICVISFLREFGDVSNTFILYALLFCFLYASSDEVHQLFVVGRNGSLIDVLIDSLGSFLGILLYRLFYRRRRQWVEKKS